MGDLAAQNKRKFCYMLLTSEILPKYSHDDYVSSELTIVTISHTSFVYLQNPYQRRPPAGRRYH